MDLEKAGGFCSRFAVWIADAAKESCADDHSSADTRAWNWGEHRDFHTAIWLGAAKFAGMARRATGKGGNGEYGRARRSRRIYAVPDDAGDARAAIVVPGAFGMERRLGADERPRGIDPGIHGGARERKRVWTARNAAVPGPVAHSI